jgi:hypothetical protein
MPTSLVNYHDLGNFPFLVPELPGDCVDLPDGNKYSEGAQGDGFLMVLIRISRQALVNWYWATKQFTLACSLAVDGVSETVTDIPDTSGGGGTPPTPLSGTLVGSQNNTFTTQPRDRIAVNLLTATGSWFNMVISGVIGSFVAGLQATWLVNNFEYNLQVYVDPDDKSFIWCGFSVDLTIGAAFYSFQNAYPADSISAFVSCGTATITINSLQGPPVTATLYFYRRATYTVDNGDGTSTEYSFAGDYSGTITFTQYTAF